MLFDGLSFFKDYGISFNTHGKNIGRGWYGLDCPYCGSHDNDLGFNPSWGSFSCWHGHPCPTIETMERLAHITNSEARAVFKQYLVESASTGPSRKNRTPMGKSIDLPGNSFTDKEIKYLKNRGLYHKTILDTYDLRSGGILGAWAWRIVIPIYYENRIVSATGRAIAKDMEVRYKTLEFDKQIIDLKTIFLGLDLASFGICAIVEGPLDAVKGGPGFLSSFGVLIKDEALSKLTKFRKVFWCMDMDEVGQVNAKKYAQYLSALGVESEIIKWDFRKEDGSLCKDIGDMSREQIDELRAELGFPKWEVEDKI